MRRVAGMCVSVGVAALLTACASAPSPRASVRLPQAADPYFTAGGAEVDRIAPQGLERARNVILFVGDGMGVSTVTAARIYAGQARGVDGESYDLTMDTFPHSAFSRTYSHNFQVADSSSTATAMTTGVKTRSAVVNVSSDVPLGDCAASQGRGVRTLWEVAEEQGLATGVVSTARITHATPAATYAHTPHRGWENDSVVASAPNGSGCADIARQLIEWPAGDGFELALGGGRANFIPRTAPDPENPTARGLRADGRDLTAEWAARPNSVFVWNAAQLAAAPENAQILGLFSPSHMAYERERAADVGGEPSLSELTSFAISRLARNPNGYVLMVEGGRVDHAHHEGAAGDALREAVELDNAVRTALEMTSRDDTLILVTADHSHTLTIAGYPPRNNPILGLTGTSDSGEGAGPTDGLPYTTLGYANGPGAMRPAGQPRANLSNVDTAAPTFRQQALIPMLSETHGGEDVPLYAWGPGDAAVSGTLEQNAIFHVMFRALGFRVQ